MKIYPVIFALLLCGEALASEIKEADLAGSWYPSSRTELLSVINRYMDEAGQTQVDGKVFAIISPHAGYRFSGSVASYGYKLVRGNRVKTVILVGFSHKRSFDGISVYNTGSFRTPLGDIRVDKVLAEKLMAQSRRFVYYPNAFQDENSIETQIPFIQVALPDASIVPIAFSGQSYQDAVILADSISKIMEGRDDFLIVASTDLSHHHKYDEANSIDKHTINIISQCMSKELCDEAGMGVSELCGIMPVTSALLMAEKLGFANVKILKYANSGDTYGDKSGVVGYLSAALYRESSSKGDKGQRGEKDLGGRMLNDSQRKRLLEIARESIKSYVSYGKRASIIESDPLLNQHMGAFVTIHKQGELRGCIGNMVGHGPLYQTVADMAVEAATGDPRFQSLAAGEVDNINIEISALSPMVKVSSPDEIKIPGHGVLVKSGFRSGVYLPQVATETGWNKEEFLTSLCGHKAGLQPLAWKDKSTELYVFSAEVFREKGE